MRADAAGPAEPLIPALYAGAAGTWCGAINISEARALDDGGYGLFRAGRASLQARVRASPRRPFRRIVEPYIDARLAYGTSQIAHFPQVDQEID